jgi:quinolinate synthase
MVESLDSEQVIFLPDEYLARNVARETGKHIIFPKKGVSKASLSGNGKSAGNPAS